MLSKFFIRRPIFSIVVAIFMVLIGLMTVKSLPVAQFPDITPPTVMVSASYPGADAKTVAETVGVPIEEQVNGVEGMMYMSSNSGSDGSYSLTVTFENGTDLDEAAVKIQNRVSQAEVSLPTSVKEQGISVMSRSTNLILFIALEGDSLHNYDALYLTNYAKLHIIDELSRVKGVGEAGAFGAGEYSMRIWLNPDKMRALGLSTSDVIEMIQSQNMAISAGSVGEPPSSVPTSFQFTLTASGRLMTAEEFGNIVLRSSNNGTGSLVRLRDIALIELGSESYSNISHVSGKDAGLIGIYQLPGANALDVAKDVEKKMAELAPYFPPGVNYRVIMNSTEFVSASIDDVLVTFIETTLIVMIVILLFLQNARAVIIPMLTIPVSLIATFAVMKLLGFTINTLTLFGMLLAIAIVVDDAIVVVEDCSRLIDEGKLSLTQAVEKAMSELQGPIVGEVLVLMSVFIPTAFISGITGELYKQFALTIAVSTAFSGFNALTFTPAMCALFLKKTKPSNFIVYKGFNKGYGAVLAVYNKIVDRFLKHPSLAIALYFVITLIAFWGFMKWPTSYVPSEDMGYFLTSVQLPTGASIERTEKVMADVEKIILAEPEVQNVISITGMSFLAGGSGSNYGSMFVVLKPWKDRKKKDEKVFEIIDRLNMATIAIQEAEIFSINPPAIPGLGLSAGLQLQLLDINNLGPGELKKAIDLIKEKGATDPRFKSITSLYQGEVPQYSIVFDRDRIKLLELTMENVFSTLADFMGGSYVNDFVEFGRVYQVNIKGDGTTRGNPEDVLKLSVMNNNGDMVPFGSFATIKPSMGEASVSRYNMYNTASLTANTAKGVSSDEGILAVEELLKEAVGNNFSYAWTGQAYQETQSGTTITLVLIFAIIITLLVLAAQYESWTDPVAVIISMPTAILGTVIGCIFMSQSISIYTQIGIILLLGMSAKNAILIVEYAIDYRKAGLDISKAAAAAGNVRFRPIMMTAFAFVFGVMPMLFASGAGAESRISLGTAVVFGMAINALVGTLFVPNFWALLQHFQEKHLAKFFKVDDSTPTTNNNTSSSV